MRIRLPRSPLLYGRWLSWLMHDISIPEQDMPSAGALRWGVRRVTAHSVDHHYNEPEPGMTPCLQVCLTRYDAVSWTGRPFSLWRTDALVQLYAGVHRVNLAEDRSFIHEENARKHFADLCTMRSQICDPPAEDWVNPAPWWQEKPIPVGSATAWCQRRQDGDLSDLFWLHALGLDVMVRRRGDGTYVHLDTGHLDLRYGPLIVEVNNSGTTEYELNNPAEDDNPDWLDVAQHSAPVDITNMAEILAAQGIATSMFGGGGVMVLRVGDLHLDPDEGEVAELAAGPASWDNDAGRYLASREDFCVGPDTQPDDPAQFWYPPADAGETVSAEYIVARPADLRGAAASAGADGQQP